MAKHDYYVEYLDRHALEVQSEVLRAIKRTNSVGVVILDACQSPTLFPAQQVKGVIKKTSLHEPCQTLHATRILYLEMSILPPN